MDFLVRVLRLRGGEGLTASGAYRALRLRSALLRLMSCSRNLGSSFSPFLRCISFR